MSEQFTHLEDLSERVTYAVYTNARTPTMHPKFLPSSTVWQWMTGISVDWILRCAADEWKELQRKLDEPWNQEAVARNAQRRSALAYVLRTIQSYYISESITRKILTRLFIQSRYCHELNVHDQDRIITMEHDIPYKTWLQFISVLAAYPDLETVFRSCHKLQGWWNHFWRPVCKFEVGEHFPQLTTIKWITQHSGTLTELANEWIKDDKKNVTVPTIITVWSDLLERQQWAIQTKERTIKIRETVLYRLGMIPVFKLRNPVGTKGSPPEPIRNLISVM